MWKNVTEDWKGRGAVEPRTSALVTLSCLITLLSLVLKFATPGRKVTRLPTTRRDTLQGQVFTQISWIRVPKREYYFGEFTVDLLLIAGLSHATGYLSHDIMKPIGDRIIRESFTDNGERRTEDGRRTTGQKRNHAPNRHEQKTSRGGRSSREHECGAHLKNPRERKKIKVFSCVGAAKARKIIK